MINSLLYNTYINPKYKYVIANHQDLVTPKLYYFLFNLIILLLLKKAMLLCIFKLGMLKNNLLAIK